MHCMDGKTDARDLVFSLKGRGCNLCLVGHMLLCLNEETSINSALRVGTPHVRPYPLTATPILAKSFTFFSSVILVPFKLISKFNLPGPQEDPQGEVPQGPPREVPQGAQEDPQGGVQADPQVRP